MTGGTHGRVRDERPREAEEDPGTAGRCLLDAAKAVLKTGHNPVFRCVDRENEKKIELELSLKAQKEAALADAERRLEEYQRGLLNRE